MEKAHIYCKFQIEIWHRWPNAPKEYTYLSYCHRHMFHFIVTAEVTDNNRQIEFIDFKNYLTTELQSLLKSDAEHPIGLSCEDMAKQSVFLVTSKYSETKSCSADVSEDGENGAWYEWAKD